MRCTAPMKAPCPPPTMPIRTRSLVATVSIQAQHSAVGRIVGGDSGEIVERLVGHLDHMIADERRTFARTLFRRLDGTFPLQHRPAGKAVLRQPREDAGKIYLPVAERAEAARAIHPGLIATVHALTRGRIEFGILHVKRADAIV